MSGPGGLARATREANERRLAELRAVSPRLADSAERALRAVEDRARRDEAAGGARDERRLGSAHGQAAARAFHGLGVELTLEDAPGDDDLRDFVGQGVHH